MSIKKQHVKLAGLILILASLACNLTSAQSTSPTPQPSPWVVFVTATPDSVQPTDTAIAPHVGPFYTIEPTSSAPPPTFDLSGLTLYPTPTSGGDNQGALPGQSTPTITPTPTATSVLETPLPSFTPTAVPPTPLPPPAADASYIPKLGINFISSAQHPADQKRIQTGKAAGAEWDRFALYWNEIEPAPGLYLWDLYDHTVNIAVTNDLNVNGILIGSPKKESDGRGVPLNLDKPVFADGTDSPGPNKKINPDNYWANYVFETVARYRPGGVMARQNNWKSGHGIRLWEIWNEPDFSVFWQGSIDEYARLLKVAYLVVNHADPHAEVMVGGLVLFENRWWFNELLRVYKNDPNPVEGRYPFDAVAIHAYNYPPGTFYGVGRVENFLTFYGLGDTPIWLNESGVAVWDDYPGPIWINLSQVVWRATQSEQADYIIQSAAFAIMAEADAIYHFQLYDDCGNQPAGTTFAPHNGELCESTGTCWGDAFGLMRNEANNICFNQHPNPNTPRPAFAAYQVIDRVFTSQPIIPLTGFTTGPNHSYYKMLFARPSTSEVITVLWNETGSPIEAELKALGDGNGQLVYKDNTTAPVTADEQGVFHILLHPATNRAQSNVPFMIGGPPVILIEKNTEPLVRVLPLIDDSLSAFLVKWRSSDPTIQKYEVWYRDEAGTEGWVRWIEADMPGEALFVGTTAHRYSFFARGQLPDGTWTLDAPVIQAWTRVE